MEVHIEKNDTDVASAAGMSVSSHVENYSRLQVGITEASVAPSGGLPDPADSRWETFFSNLSQAYFVARDEKKVDGESFNKGLWDVSYQMK